MKKSSGPYMQQAGRGNMEKTGRGIPMEFQGPKMHEPNHENPGDGEKVETTQSRTSRDGIEGTLTTIKTTTPGTGGADIGVKRKTYKQFKAEGGDVEAAKAYNASIAPTPDQVDIQERFTADSPKLTSQPIKPFKPEMPKGESIKRLAKPLEFFSVQADRGGGVAHPDQRRPVSLLSQNHQSGKVGAIPTWERVATRGQAAAVVQSVNAENAALNKKYSEENIRAQHAKKGGNLERMLASAKARRESNQSQATVRRISFDEAMALNNRTFDEKRRSGTSYKSQNAGGANYRKKK